MQAAEIVRLEQRLAAFGTVIDELLMLAQQIRPYTIDAILAKSDVELGLDVPMGKLRPPQSGYEHKRLIIPIQALILHRDIDE